MFIVTKFSPRTQDFEESLTALHDLLQTPEICKLLTAPMAQVKEWEAREVDLLMMQRTDAILSVIARAEKTSQKLQRLHAVHTA